MVDIKPDLWPKELKIWNKKLTTDDFPFVPVTPTIDIFFEGLSKKKSETIAICFLIFFTLM